jgi:hypothetical protein
VIADPAIRLTVTHDATPSPELPPTEAIMVIYTRVVQSMWPGLTVMPSMDAGSTLPAEQLAVRAVDLRVCAQRVTQEATQDRPHSVLLRGEGGHRAQS